jgi:phosphoribosylformylglycinamidine synthase
MAKKVGILRFLGTNCDRDVWQAIEELGSEPEWLWYQDHFDPKDYSAFVLPGGFSYGDYLRCGALAARMPVMESLAVANKKGYPILGICNGFQILCEAGFLPGALIRNKKRKFIDDWVEMDLSHSCQAWGDASLKRVKLPIAHGEGQYYIQDDELKKIQDQEQIWWTYKKNPNGSIADIAGVMNEKKNVAAMMPHPERAIFEWMGSKDGRQILTSQMRGL